jgi:biopolymer transport protein ExbB/TolQ
MSSGLVENLLNLPIFEAEWVLWLLIALSFMSVAVMVERVWFYRQHAVDAEAIRAELTRKLDRHQYQEAIDYLAQFDSLETNVVRFGLREYEKGAASVQELLEGAEAKERERYNKRLGFLATLGANGPFIGLFGTVLGVIKAFSELGDDLSGAGNGLMSGISEALVATGVGLIVAIPAVIAYNIFVGKVDGLAANTSLLSKTLLARLKAVPSGRTLGAE